MGRAAPFTGHAGQRWALGGDTALKLSTSLSLPGRQLLQAYGRKLPPGAYALGLLYTEDSYRRRMLQEDSAPTGMPNFIGGYGQRANMGSSGAYGA